MIFWERLGYVYWVFYGRVGLCVRFSNYEWVELKLRLV